MTVQPIRRQWITVHAVCEATGLAPYTVYRLAREGKIPAHRIPNTRSVRFDRAEIDNWMSAAPKASA